MGIGLIWKVQFLKRVRFRLSFLCHLKVHNKISHWIKEKRPFEF